MNGKFATENGAVIEEISNHSAVCSLVITDSHRNAMGAVMGGTYSYSHSYDNRIPGWINVTFTTVYNETEK